MAVDKTINGVTLPVKDVEQVPGQEWAWVHFQLKEPITMAPDDRLEVLNPAQTEGGSFELYLNGRLLMKLTEEHIKEQLNEEE